MTKTKKIFTVNEYLSGYEIEHLAGESRWLSDGVDFKDALFEPWACGCCYGWGCEYCEDGYVLPGICQLCGGSGDSPYINEDKCPACGGSGEFHVPEVGTEVLRLIWGYSFNKQPEETLEAYFPGN